MKVQINTKLTDKNSKGYTSDSIVVDYNADLNGLVNMAGFELGKDTDWLESPELVGDFTWAMEALGGDNLQVTYVAEKLDFSLKGKAVYEGEDGEDITIDIDHSYKVDKDNINITLISNDKYDGIIEYGNVYAVILVEGETISCAVDIETL